MPELRLQAEPLADHKARRMLIGFIKEISDLEASPGIEPGCKDLQSSA